jgi:hypothetical protein
MIGDGVDLLGAKNCFDRFSGLPQQSYLNDLVHNLRFDDQFDACSNSV